MARYSRWVLPLGIAALAAAAIVVLLAVLDVAGQRYESAEDALGDEGVDEFA